MMMMIMTAFAYFMINPFNSISTKLTSAILLRLVHFCFDIFSLYGVLCCSQKKFSFSLKAFLFLAVSKFSRL